MESQVLQPVSGCKNIEVYPYIRKIDLMSSNSYILSGEYQIALIDPGGLDDQVSHLLEKVVEIHDEEPRPVVVYLTHAHADHCCKLNRCREFRDLDILLAAQECGAEALEAQDSRFTLATMLGKSIEKTKVDIRLLASHDKRMKMECSHVGGGDRSARLTRSVKIPHGPLMESQVIQLGNKDQMEIYHIPGHSPDSICMRVGSLLFIGDIFFAPNPGMAGAYGWSQTDLLDSIQKVIWILEHSKIELCCSGHGRSIDADKAWSTLKSMYGEVSTLSDIGVVDSDWARNIAAYAEDLMRELERVFIIIAGRLTYISHVLSELEEESEAKDTELLLDAERIDELFADFNSFVTALHAGRKLNIELVHKAGQVVARLESVFENRRIGSLMDHSLLQRASRMLNDYTMTYRGFKPPFLVAEVDVNQVIREVHEELLHKPYEDEAILDAESDEDYIWALKARIAHIDLFESVALRFVEGPGLPQVRMDRERFTDVLIDIFERLVGSRSREIRVETLYEDGWVAVCITGVGSDPSYPMGERALRFFERSLALCGGLLQIYPGDEGIVAKIEFTPGAGLELADEA